MRRWMVDFWVGLFVVAGIGALFVLALKVGSLGNVRVEDPYQVFAYFDNVGGLKTRAPVRSAGVVVGRIGDIAFDPQGYRAKVTLLIQKKFRFPRDTSAKILTSGLLGEQYVGLEPGGDEEMLAEGEIIELTQSAVVLENLIGQLLYNMGDSKDDKKK